VKGLATRLQRSAPQKAAMHVPIRAGAKPSDLDAAQALVVALGAALAPFEATCARHRSP
jgi:hypothetical protein